MSDQIDFSNPTFRSLAAFFTDYFGLLHLFQIWESSPTPIGFSASVLHSLHRGTAPAKPWTCIRSQIQWFFRTFRHGPRCFFECRLKQSKPRKACMEKLITRAEKWPEQKTTIMPQSCQLVSRKEGSLTKNWSGPDMSKPQYQQPQATGQTVRHAACRMKDFVCHSFQPCRCKSSRFSLCDYFWGHIFVRLSRARSHPQRYPMLEKLRAQLRDLRK